MPGVRRALLTVVCAVVVALAAPACSSGGGGSTAGSAGSAGTVAPGAGTGSGSSAGSGGLIVPTGYTAVTLVVTRPDGTTVEWCVWLADTEVERARGLMEVTDPGLGGKAGMAFRFPADVEEAFWMRNTRLPLTIAYAAADGRIVSTTDMSPCPDSDATCPTYPAEGPYRLALEVPQGRLDDLGIDASSRLALGGSC